MSVGIGDGSIAVLIFGLSSMVERQVLALKILVRVKEPEPKSSSRGLISSSEYGKLVLLGSVKATLTPKLDRGCSTTPVSPTCKQDLHVPLVAIIPLLVTPLWGGGRAVYCASLENWRTERFQGFESLPPHQALRMISEGGFDDRADKTTSLS